MLAGFMDAIDMIEGWYIDMLIQGMHPADAEESMHFELEGVLTTALFTLSKRKYKKITEYAEAVFEDFTNEIHELVA